jgi:hypothetical protein
MLAVPAASALALWGAAHAAGAPSDDVLAAIRGFGVGVGVRRDGVVPDGSPAAALPGPGEAATGPAALLPLLRSAAPSLVLPRPGDVRGLPVPAGSATVAALRAGAAVVLVDAGLTIVPLDGQWRVFAAAGRPAPDELLLAREGLDEAVSRATEVFIRTDLGVQAETARDEVAEYMYDTAIQFPPGTRGRTVALLDRCVQLEALLAVISRHRTAAVNGHELDQVQAALGPLADAARAGRVAAINNAVRELLSAAVRPGGRLVRDPSR